MTKTDQVLSNRRAFLRNAGAAIAIPHYPESRPRWA